MIFVKSFFGNFCDNFFSHSRLERIRLHLQEI